MLKTRPKILLALLAALVLLLAANTLRDRLRGDRSFKALVVDIDPAAVDRVTLGAADDIVVLDKSADGWRATDAAGRSRRADQQAADALVAELANLKVERLAGRGPERWAAAEVDDSLGTPVALYRGGKQLARLVVGKFSYRQAPGGQGVALSSLVREAGDDDVYQVAGAVSMAARRGFDAFADKTLLRLDPQQVAAVDFRYPGDTAFALSRQGQAWFLGRDTADAGKVLAWLGDVADSRAASLAGVPAEGEPTARLAVRLADGTETTVDAWSDGAGRFTFATSQNSEPLADSEHLFKRIFVARDKFAR